MSDDMIDKLAFYTTQNLIHTAELKENLEKIDSIHEINKFIDSLSEYEAKKVLRLYVYKNNQKN